MIPEQISRLIINHSPETDGLTRGARTVVASDNKVSREKALATVVAARVALTHEQFCSPLGVSNCFLIQ